MRLSTDAARDPEVSVVIPTRNRRDLLMRTLASVLRQRDIDLEVVLVDDGSTDDTALVIANLREPRIRFFRNDRSTGVSAARNRGIEEARGSWIAFLDDDDLWAPDKLVSQRDAARELGRSWAYSGSVAVSSADLQVLTGFPPPPAERVVRRLPWRNTVVGGASSVMVQRELLKSVGGFDTGLRHMADWDMWIRLSVAGGPPAIVARPLLGYVQHASNASADIAEIPGELEVVGKRYEHLRDGSSPDRAYVYRWMAWNAIRANRRGTAIRCYLRAIAAGDRTSLARLLVTAVHPFISTWVAARQTSPPEWRAEADAWLNDLR